MTTAPKKTVHVAGSRRASTVHYLGRMALSRSPQSTRAERKEERFQTDLVVKLEGGVEGLARNVSPSGIFFVTDAALVEGQPVKFSLEFKDFPSGPVEVNCSARVVRVEEQGARRGIGASIDSFEFRTLPRAGKSSH